MAIEKGRYDGLKGILEERRKDLTIDIPYSHGIEDDLELALMELRSETIGKIDDALRRLKEATYGYCFECGKEISERRLRALPFALRCKNCEEAREVKQQRERLMAQRRGPLGF